jgi:hypothetical protein
MADKKGFGSTVLGWFVVRDGEDARKDQSADELIAKYSNDAPPPPPPEVKLQGELPRATGGNVDYAAVFRAAGINDEEQARIDKAMSLLKTLPAETPKDVKKQIVEASLKAFGVPIEEIIEAGALEIQALEVYIQHGKRDTQALLAESTKRTEELATEIQRIKTVMEQQVTAQGALETACNQQKLKVQEVLEFFGQEAVARVVSQSPKLHEPK